MDLNSKTVAELRGLIRENGYPITGYSKMKKAELVARLQAIAGMPLPPSDEAVVVPADEPAPADDDAPVKLEATPGTVVVNIDGVDVKANATSGMVCDMADWTKADAMVESGKLEQETTNWANVRRNDYFLAGPEYRGYKTAEESDDEPTACPNPFPTGYAVPPTDEPMMTSEPSEFSEKYDRSDVLARWADKLKTLSLANLYREHKTLEEEYDRQEQLGYWAAYGPNLTQDKINLIEAEINKRDETATIQEPNKGTIEIVHD
jgi:hypothetical protein